MAANTKKKKTLGSVCKGGKGWTARYYDLDENNERERKTKRGFASEDEAYAFLATKEKELRDKETALSKYVENREITLRDYLVNWFEHIYSKKIANSTETTYRYTLYKYLLPALDDEYPQLKLVDLKKNQINRIIRLVFNQKPSYAMKVKELFIPCMAIAKQDNLIVKNPAYKLTVPSYSEKNFRPLKKNEIAILLRAAASTPTYLEMLLALLMGMRKGEIYGLKFEDINFENQTMHLRQQCAYEHEFEGMTRLSSKQIEKELKTEGSERIIYIPDVILQQILIRKERIQQDKKRKRIKLTYEDNGYVCSQRNGRPRAGSCLNKALRKLTDENDLPPIPVHFLRHMTATILLYLKFDLVTISRILGHSNMQTTLKYYCADLDGDIEITSILNKLLEEAFGGGDIDEVREEGKPVSA